MTASGSDGGHDRLAALCLGRVCELLAVRDYAEAAEAAACGVIEFPLDGRFWELGGVAHWMGGHTEASVLSLEEASVLKPLHPFSQVALADGYEQSGKRELARVIWGFLSGPIGGPRLVAALDRPAGSAPDYHLAFAAYRAVTDREPRNHHAWFGLGASLGRAGGDPERAADCFAVAVRLAPGVVPYRLNLAEACVLAGDRRRAAEVMAWFDPARVGCPCALNWAAEVFEQLGNPSAAAACRRAGELHTGRTGER